MEAGTSVSLLALAASQIIEVHAPSSVGSDLSWQQCRELQGTEARGGGSRLS
jgi:hypothetical protein